MRADHEHVHSAPYEETRSVKLCVLRGLACWSPDDDRFPGCWALVARGCLVGSFLAVRLRLRGLAISLRFSASPRGIFLRRLFCRRRDQLKEVIAARVDKPQSCLRQAL